MRSAYGVAPPKRPLVVLSLLVAACNAAAQEDCFADCADGLVPVEDGGPRTGAQAPLFTASRFEPATGVIETKTLDAWIVDRPVVLAFGSYT